MPEVFEVVEKLRENAEYWSAIGAQMEFAADTDNAYRKVRIDHIETMGDVVAWTAGSLTEEGLANVYLFEAIPEEEDGKMRLLSDPSAYTVNAVWFEDLGDPAAYTVAELQEESPTAMWEIRYLEVYA